MEASNINIEEATEDDYPKLIEIEHLSFSSDLLTIEDLQNIHYSIFVIKENDVVVGFYVSYFNEDDFSNYLETIEIHPEHRRKGYSKLLLEHYINNSNGPCIFTVVLTIKSHLHYILPMDLNSLAWKITFTMEEERHSFYVGVKKTNENQNKSDFWQCGRI